LTSERWISFHSIFIIYLLGGVHHHQPGLGLLSRPLPVRIRSSIFFNPYEVGTNDSYLSTHSREVEAERRKEDREFSFFFSLYFLHCIGHGMLSKKGKPAFWFVKGVPWEPFFGFERPDSKVLYSGLWKCTKARPKSVDTVVYQVVSQYDKAPKKCTCI
jgi:hypothetical protein